MTTRKNSPIKTSRTIPLLVLFGLAAGSPAQAQSLTLHNTDNVSVSGAGTAGTLGGQPVAPPMSSVTSYSSDGNVVSVYDAASFTLGAGGTLTGTSNYADALFADSSGTVTVTGGTLAGGGFSSGLFADGGSPVRVSGGTFSGEQAVAAYGSGSVVITGGTFNNELLAYFGGTLTVAGGTFNASGTGLAAANDGNPNTVINLFGSGFKVNGVPFTSGQLPSGSGTLTGTLLYDTMPFSTGYSNDNAIININVGPPPAPEPSQAVALGLGLLGLAGLAFRARNRRVFAA